MLLAEVKAMKSHQVWDMRKLSVMFVFCFLWLPSANKYPYDINMYCLESLSLVSRWDV